MSVVVVDERKRRKEGSKSSQSFFSLRESAQRFIFLLTSSEEADFCERQACSIWRRRDNNEQKNTYASSAGKSRFSIATPSSASSDLQTIFLLDTSLLGRIVRLQKLHLICRAQKLSLLWNNDEQSD